MCSCKKKYPNAQKTHSRAFFVLAFIPGKPKSNWGRNRTATRPPKLLRAKPTAWFFPVATKWLLEKSRGYKNAKMPYKSTAQADFSMATKGKNGSPYLYILIFAKYSTEYLAYYVYVHIFISKRVIKPSYRRAKKYECNFKNARWILPKISPHWLSPPPLGGGSNPLGLLAPSVSHKRHIAHAVKGEADGVGAPHPWLALGLNVPWLTYRRA